MLWPRAHSLLLLLLASTASSMANAANTTVVAEAVSSNGSSAGSWSSSSSSAAYANEVLPGCNDTAATTFYWDNNTALCLDATGFSFASVATPLSSENASRICQSLPCRRIYEAAASVDLSSDCVLNDNGVRLQADVLDELSWFCENGMASASGSAYTDPNVGYVGATGETSDHMTIATVVCISVAALLAFIIVVVAVVWYKRKSLQDLRRHAYTDPLVEVKPRAGGGGIFNAQFARRMRERLSIGSARTQLTATTGSVNHTNIVPLRPIQPTFHGDTLWSDEELLARHMRAEDIEDIRVIGNGGHGVVYLVRHRGSRLLASKRLVQDHITREKTRLLIAEIKLVAKLEHPCIVQFVGAAWTTESDLQALFEYMPNGDLCTHLAKTSQPDERESWDLGKVQIAMDIAEALVYVHSFAPPLVHRDLKSRNVLLDENRRAKLTDFGVSRFYSTSNTMTTGIGTSRWLAPEVMAGGGTYDQSCDIYSLGIVLSELDTHRLPFAGLRMPSGNPMPEMSILQLVSQGKLQPSFRSSCPASLREIALRCVAFDPVDRPSAIEVSYALRTIAKKEFGM